ncbi:FecCD family ABC transporter permease [Cryobacterium zhongshanensis]|uniref:Iron chelate uptake ABC transporter family permease subunit n=1 Tax=Cryobacterium zhongshanensis TaxID=2928153 RepID=A0AA41QSF2_9MICO|nr:iron chelate uptake ABC transporter family permease subunit [Cryobacterium zhongshanensis]MCI4656815.1 iron chelate uptake ABC transporter family permease subunit [Cryobacterium zhongshanensis]
MTPRSPHTAPAAPADLAERRRSRPGSPVHQGASAEAAILGAARGARRRTERRVVIVLAAALLVVAALSLSVGSYSLSVPDLLRTLAGQGTGAENFIVLTLRLPRVVLALLTGIAFALSGALFQTVLRNPLASPDIVGVTGGASAAAVLGMLVLGFGSLATAFAAFGGAILVATVIYLLAWRGRSGGAGGVAGYRFVLIGVGVAFMVQGLIGYLLTRAQLRDAQDALTWLVGSVSGAAWPEIAVVAVGLAVLLPIVWMLAPRLRALQLGDDLATSLGVGAERNRLGLLIVAVALAALATAMVGPLAFVAFVSAPIARRLAGTGGLSLVPAALVGALIVSAADFAAQHLLPGGLQLPAGVVTGAIGAPYLLWLLATGAAGGSGSGSARDSTEGIR